MTPKEKALELVQKYFKGNHQPYGFKDAKQCALIAVDEILDGVIDTLQNFNYWKQVKQEIEKL